jgi:hypothetical protein
METKELQVLLLTLAEAAKYVGIGINKMREISNDNDEMTIFIGNKRMIKRKVLEQYIDNAMYSI